MKRNIIKRVQAGITALTVVILEAFLQQQSLASSIAKQPQDDSIVGIAADMAGLQQVPYDSLPRFGTFWTVKSTPIVRITAPLPFPPKNTNAIVYALSETQFLVDATDGEATTAHSTVLQAYNNSTLDALELQTDMLLSFITRYQDAGVTRQTEMLLQSLIPPVIGGGGSSTNSGTNATFGSFYDYSVDTNLLWLQITNVNQGVTYLNLHNATNAVYAILSKTSLNDANWTVETEVWPTNSATMPFHVFTLNREALFLRAMDWTGTAHGENIIPDWWLWFYFGTADMTDSDLDYIGNQILYDFVNNLDPNPVTAYQGYYSTCQNTPLSITLTGSVSCANSFPYYIYDIVTPPMYGYLGRLSETDSNFVYIPQSPSFTGYDSFTYQVYPGWQGNSAIGNVTVMVGDAYIQALQISPMTGTNRPVELVPLISRVLPCTNLPNMAIIGGPSHGSVSHSGTNYIYTPTNNYEGLDTLEYVVSDGVWTNSPAIITIFVVAGPKLNAQCRSDRIILNWDLDDITKNLISSDGLSVSDFQIYRRTNNASFTTNDLLAVQSSATFAYYDTAIIHGVTYQYAVTFRYQDVNTGRIYESPFSNTAISSTCTPAYVGPMDVAFIIDNTASMQISLAAIQQAVSRVVADIAIASSNNFRLAVVTPDTDGDYISINGIPSDAGHDMVVVRLSLTNDTTVFSNTIASIQSGPGSSTPESTDECLNTIIHALSALGRIDTNGCAPANKLLQLYDFTPAFRTDSSKRIVLLTDALPGGFCTNTVTVSQAHQYALDAKASDIKINAIQLAEN